MFECKWLDNGIKEIIYTSECFSQCYSSERE